VPPNILVLQIESAVNIPLYLTVHPSTNERERARIPPGARWTRDVYIDRDLRLAYNNSASTRGNLDEEPHEDQAIGRKAAERPGAQSHIDQCGKCSAGCPVAFAMDLLPSQVIRLVQLGLEEALEANAIWYCASCQTCLSRCPRGVDLPRIMEALRQIVLRDQGDRLAATDLPDDLLAEAPQLAIIGILRKHTS